MWTILLQGLYSLIFYIALQLFWNRGCIWSQTKILQKLKFRPDDGDRVGILVCTTADWLTNRPPNTAIHEATMLAWQQVLMTQSDIRPQVMRNVSSGWCLPVLPCFCVMSWQRCRRVCSDHQYWCCPMCRSGRCSPSCCRPNYRRRGTEEKEEQRSVRSRFGFRYETF